MRSTSFKNQEKAKEMTGENYISAGVVPRSFALNLDGIFRYVYTNEKGLEFTKGIISEERFLSSYSAMKWQTPSFYSIEALEEATIIELNYDRWLQLKSEDSYWTEFLLTLVEGGYRVKEKRERELLLLSAEERYLNFLKDYPGMINRVKQSIVASFIGIQPESLSRIRKNIGS